jgi:hypothetical protein
MKLIAWIKALFICKHRKEKHMSELTANMQKSAISALRSDAVVIAVLNSVYAGYSEEDARSAVKEFMTHLTLHDEENVKATLGDYFDPIQAAFATQEAEIAAQVTDQVIADDKAAVKGLVETYVRNLQYKHSIDNGQDTGA